MNPMYLYQYDAIVYMFEYWWWTLQILLNNSTIYRVGAGGLNSTTATQTLEDNGQLLHVLTGAPFDEWELDSFTTIYGMTRKII